MGIFKWWRTFLFAGLLVPMINFYSQGAAGQETGPIEDTFTVLLPCVAHEWDEGACAYNETIEIPKGRPIYALLVSGFHQNKNLDMFHFYNFAKCLQDKGAYVHYAWWNNLLAPYMERPLHNALSVPSYKANPWEAVLNILPNPNVLEAKANPRDDYQFQADAEALLAAIRLHNPDTTIVVVGHSMGGDAVARLGANTNIDIDLLAPIDPVGNRSCLPCGPNCLVQIPKCTGLDNFTRKQTTRADFWYHAEPWNALIPKITEREFGENIKYLYHRWQQEYLPPFDYGVAYHFVHPDDVVNTIEEGSTNVQSRISNSWLSDKEVPEYLSFGGALDGHGEIVGFRGTILDLNVELSGNILDYLDINNYLSIESHPLALKAQGDWPSWPEGDIGERIEYLKAWEKDPNYLYKEGYEPWNPGLCMVSRDLCKILDTIVPDNLPPDALCQNVTVPVEAGTCTVASASVNNGSFDPDDDPISVVQAPAGPYVFGNTTVTLTVTDDSGASDSCTATMTIVDATAPNLTPPSYVTTQCASSNGTAVALGAPTISDQCDSNPTVTNDAPAVFPLGKTIVNWTATDATGNTTTEAQEVSVLDSVAPTIGVTVSPDTLWPPNHKYVSIETVVAASDICDANPSIVLTSVESNEPDNGKGDGNTVNDIVVDENGKILLRAERSFKGNGRVYTITYDTTDASGNTASESAAVTVPNNHLFFRKFVHRFFREFVEGKQ